MDAAVIWRYCVEKQQKLLLRVTEAADLASISRSMAYELVAAGTWPSITIGRAVRVPLADLERWIDDQKRSSSGSGRDQ